MYSPKISEELIPRLYQLAREKGVSMRALVNEILREALIQAEGEAGKEESDGTCETKVSPIVAGP